jgi:hypothetical protein
VPRGSSKTGGSNFTSSRCARKFRVPTQAPIVVGVQACDYARAVENQAIHIQRLAIGVDT